MRYAKAYVAALGAGLTAAAGIVTAGSTAGQWITIALAVVTALGTYAMPNTPAVPAFVQAVRAQQAKPTGKHSSPSRKLGEW